jgi:hypothetical protein
MLQYALRPQSEFSKKLDEQNAAAQEFALPHLKEFGIVSLNDDVLTVESGGDMALMGTGQDASGKSHTLNVLISTENSSDIADWKIERIDLDGEIGVDQK